MQALRTDKVASKLPATAQQQGDSSPGVLLLPPPAPYVGSGDVGIRQLLQPGSLEGIKSPEQGMTPTEASLLCSSSSGQCHVARGTLLTMAGRSETRECQDWFSLQGSLASLRPVATSE